MMGATRPFDDNRAIRGPASTKELPKLPKFVIAKIEGPASSESSSCMQLGCRALKLKPEELPKLPKFVITKIEGPPHQKADSCMQLGCRVLNLKPKELPKLP